MGAVAIAFACGLVFAAGFDVTPFSFAHRFLQSGPFRPDPEDRRLPGVVFAGAGTRPGLGLPLAPLGRTGLKSRPFSA